jgi:hypothetical protein
MRKRESHTDQYGVGGAQAGATTDQRVDREELIGTGKKQKAKLTATMIR